MQIVRIYGLQICVLGRVTLLVALRRVRHVDLTPIFREQQEVEALADGIGRLLADGSAVRTLELGLTFMPLQLKRLAVALPRSGLRRLALRGAHISRDDARDLARAFAVSGAARVASCVSLIQRRVPADECDAGGDRVRIVLSFARRRRDHRLRPCRDAAARAARTSLCGREVARSAPRSRLALALAAALTQRICHALPR